MEQDSIAPTSILAERCWHNIRKESKTTGKNAEKALGVNPPKCLYLLILRNSSERIEKNSCSPEQIRTADFQLRRLTFYPAELRDQMKDTKIRKPVRPRRLRIPSAAGP